MPSQHRSRVDGHEPVVVDQSVFQQLEIERPKTMRDVQNAIGTLLKALKINLEVSATFTIHVPEGLVELVRSTFLPC